MNVYRTFGKRLFDIALVIALSPMILIAGLVLWLFVRVNLGKPALFAQTRPGRFERPFTLRKFRTMTDDRDSNGNLLPDEVRLTTFGRWMRATSLDELPELWNVLTGEMSLVGPRPLLMRYLPLYSATQARRHEVRPGVTGLAQVKGRNSVSWEQKFDWDVEYVDRHSFAVDVAILVRTVSVVWRREGVSQAGHATMDEFRGSR